MKILAIETSCDDTGLSIIETPSKNGGGFNVLSNIVASQIKVHRKYGGVYPMMAKREHQANLVPVLVQALRKAKLANSKSEILNPKPARGEARQGRQIPNALASTRSLGEAGKLQIIKKILEREEILYEKLSEFLQKYEKPKIDLIAVTNGPGLEPCLWVGVNFAKALSYFWNIPIVPVNHIESHILVNFLNQKPRNIFPAISLVVSGGHTQLILVKGIGKYKIIGETRDDAAGECFDKCAKILGLEYPGGPAIAKMASQWKSQIPNPKFETISNFKFQILNLRLPRPMISSKDYDFSFSGLKTAVLYLDKKTKNKSLNYKKEMAHELQQAIIDVLIKKTIKAAKDFKVKSIILGGGVSANQELRKQLAEKIKKEFPVTKYLAPDAKLSTDNALMIAVAGYFHRDEQINPSVSSGRFSRKIEAQANLRV